MRHGFRTLNNKERSRAMGAADFLHALDLPTGDVYNAQAHHFDRNLITIRLSIDILAYLKGDAIDKPQYLTPQNIELTYIQIQGSIRATGSTATNSVAIPDAVRSEEQNWGPPPAPTAHDGAGAAAPGGTQ